MVKENLTLGPCLVDAVTPFFVKGPLHLQRNLLTNKLA